ncbi:hypothetical protein [Mycolicibacterium neworleansense]|uniref:Uncharacterized protein n=1 Tax=Mycolicibacterium neworleansense TaxID=146018 RepID=A0A0H5RRK2_9MYCO|nr:hypothetical protein [Mycolicibacterium neworleansense]MCV7362543.1 hypothetical protein [Mycolicibacterium neworleansense]CRZ16583.1 hypothetical protein BN2156_03453 [Mycolicibacterium neworleansense]
MSLFPADGKPMFDRMLAVGPHEPKSFATLLTIGLVISAFCVAVFVLIALIPSTARDREDAEKARLFTHSEAFWARWPGNGLFEAPYDQLAAEATRCARIVEIFQGERGSNVRPATGHARRAYDNAEIQLASYEPMLNSVHNAMNYAISQGRGPQLPSK